MKDFTFPEEKIIHLKRFQNIVKKKIKIKRELNLELNSFYNLIYGIMTRIYHSFLLGIINQYDYNSYMNQLDEQLIIFKKLKRPLGVGDINNNCRKNVNSTLKLLRNNLKELTSKCGLNNIFDGIKLVINKIDKNFLENMDYETKNLLYFYQKVFVPTSMDFYNINKETGNDSNDLILFNNKLDKETYDFKNINKSKGIRCYNIHKKQPNFIEDIQGARLYVPLKFNNKNYYFVFNGYFNEDPLNLSRVGGLFEKKHKQIKEIINKLEINEYFKNAYLQQISLRDFIINSVDTLADKCINSYEELLFLKKQTISSLVKDFLVSDISKQRDILTLFLLMKDDIDTQYLAYLMYDMITNESYLLKPQPLAEQVYNSLHWSVQKLFKVAIKKVNNDISKLLNFNEEEISYEKRIMLMKTNDVIKSKAMDKFKEYSKSGESSAKCLQYLDGILKIPFSIYKKEKILTFLSEFRGVLKNFINSNFDSKINNEICSDFKKLENITSNHIDHFFNNFDNDVDPEYFGNYDILKILKKMKKNDLRDLIRLINDDEGDNNIYLTAFNNGGFTSGNNGDMNVTGRTYVAYLFRTIEGFSKFGQYTGSGGADGPFIQLPFKPRMFWIKNIDSSSGWSIIDTARYTRNDANGPGRLEWNFNSAEVTGSSATREMDILANGVKIRTSNTNINVNGGHYVYGAWADVPFKYNNTLP